jgi:hypothetical protein
MNETQNTSGNSSFVSIRYAPLSKVLPDANEHEEAQPLLIDIVALRSISRIVKEIKNKIAGADGNRPGINGERDAAEDTSSPTNTSSNRGTNINREKKR